MKQIRLKRLRLLNFKGARQLSADFGGEATSVAGRNGTGKTTLFDAFTWVLFGKDSLDRKAFDIKTLDIDGAAIPKIPHEVEAVLEVGGQEVTLLRRYSEKWVKPRGQAQERFQGHEEERFYNGVPCTLSEYNDKVADICPELVFKLITSPAYFASLKPDAQRDMLFKMVGGFSDNEVVAASGQRADFIALLGKLTGKTMEEFRREVGAKKAIVKKELAPMPALIDENKRKLAADRDWAELEQSLARARAEIAELDNQLADRAALAQAQAAPRLEAQRRLTEWQMEMARIEGSLRRKAEEERRKAEDQRRAEQGKIDELLGTANSLEQRLAVLEGDAATLKRGIEERKAERERLLQDFAATKQMRAELAQSDLACPTCGRPYEPERIEERKREIRAKVNARAAEEQARINRAGQENNRQTQLLQARLEKARADWTEAKNKIDSLRAKAQAMESELAKAEPLPPVDLQAICQADYEWQKYAGLIAKAQSDLAAAPSGEGADTAAAEIIERKRAATERADSLVKDLAVRDSVQQARKRISELEEQMRALSDELANLEGMEFTMDEFSRARVNALEGKINSLFSIVRFKMFDTQVNGAVVETCEAMVDGRPYSTQNSAMRINMGLDIINAICRWQRVSAPIFIDNCESILEPIATEGQQVRLYVADKDLTIN